MLTVSVAPSAQEHEMQLTAMMYQLSGGSEGEVAALAASKIAFKERDSAILLLENKVL